jgi:rhomboid family GlyGly-CTERM serine protease
MGLHELEGNGRKVSGLGQWLLPGALVLLAIFLLLGGELAREWLRFDRQGIRSGEVWRLVTGHVVHLGWSHFLLNAAGLALVWFLVGSAYDIRRWVLVCALSIVSMDIGLWVFDPTLQWYVGLSGLLHGILAAGLIAALEKPDKETLVLLLLLIAKLAWEQYGGPLPGSEATAGGRVVVNSHLFGAIGGAVAALLLRIRVRNDTPI